MVDYWAESLPVWSYDHPPASMQAKVTSPNISLESRPQDVPWAYKIRQRKEEHSSWVKIDIEGSSYYGRKLAGKDWEREKMEMVLLKIIPLFTVSILLAPFVIPFCFATGVYRELGLRIRQVYYNMTFDYRIENQTLSPVNQKFPLASLTEEMIVHLFASASLSKSIEARKYLQPLLCVSKQWNRIMKITTLALINKGILWITDVPWGGHESKKFTNYILDNQKAIRTLKLKIHNEDKWKGEAFPEKLLAGCPHLETLSLTFFSKLTQVGIEALANLKALKNLKLCLGELDSGADLSFMQFSNLEKLRLSELHHMPSFEGLHQLKTLKLKCCHLKTPIPSFSPLKQLKVLHISETKGPFPSFDPLVELEELKIFGTGTEEEPILSFKTLHKLKKLRFFHPTVEKIEISPTAPLERIKSIPRFIDLAAINPKYLYDLDLHDFFCKDLADQNALKRFKKLRSLKVDGLAIDVLSSLPHLEHLRVWPHKKKNWEWYHHIPEQLKIQLKTLRMCLENDPFPQSLNEFSNLETLAIHGGAGVLPSLDRLTKLHTLMITRNEETQATLSSLRELSSLHHLTLVGCAQLTLLPSTLEHLVNLRILRIQSCPIQPDTLNLNYLIRLQKAECIYFFERQKEPLYPRARANCPLPRLFLK